MKYLAALLLLVGVADAQVPGPVTGLQAWSAPTSGGPQPNSVTAATATALDNALCTAERPFYWEVGDATATRAFGSVGTPAVTATTKQLIASASKWVLGMYVLQLRGSVGALTMPDIQALSQIDGYTNAPDKCTTSTISACALLVNSTGNAFTGCGAGQIYGWQNTSCPSGSGDNGVFSYNGWHFNNEAIANAGLSGSAGTTTALNATIFGLIDPGNGFIYTQPQVGGGLYGSPNNYTRLLKLILNNALVMHDALGTNESCTHPHGNYSGQTINGSAGPSNCPATYAPIVELWRYSMAHWHETDPSTSGDGAFSSPGAFGFYPWIDSSKTYYGVVVPATGNNNSGSDSVKCGRLIRHAWITGVEQTDPIPDLP